MQFDIEKILDFSDDLSDLQKKTLFDSAQDVTLKKGGIFSPDALKSYGFAVLKKGRARAFLSCEDGREIMLFEIGAQSPVLNIYSPDCEKNSVEIQIEAVCDCEFVMFGRNCLKTLCSQSVTVQNYFLKLRLDESSKISNVLKNALFLSFDKRLALYLLSASEQAKSPYIKTTHEQIAKNLGSAREVVSRMLKYFASQNAVSLMRGKIKIENAEFLKSLLN